MRTKETQLFLLRSIFSLLYNFSLNFLKISLDFSPEISYNISMSLDTKQFQHSKFIDTITDPQLRRYLEFRYRGSFQTEVEKFVDSQTQSNRDSRFQEIENRRVERRRAR
jgi:hypothetical protein